MTPVSSESIKTLRALVESGVEASVQQYLEENVHLLVGNHYVCNGIVVSQLVIGGFKTDFAYINEISGASPVYFIEIARPSVEMFQENDEFRAEFNHELQQVRDWIHEFSRIRGPSQCRFARRFGERFSDFLSVAAERGRLYIGRRSEINNFRRKDRWEALSHQLQPFIEIRTFDALIDEDERKGAFVPLKCVK